MGLQPLAHMVEEEEEEAREGEEAREARFALGTNTGICEVKGIPNAENAWYDHEGRAASAAVIVYAAS